MLLLTGIGMFCFGVAAFTWSGPGLSQFMSNLGKYSFLLWLPTIIVGLALIAVGGKRKMKF